MGVFSLALAAFLAWGAYGLTVEHRRAGDFDRWIDQPGILESLVLRQPAGGESKDFLVDCQYAYEVDGRPFRGTTFDFGRPGFASVEHAKAYVERELELAGKVSWRRVDRATGVAWMLEPAGLAVTVSRSPHDPAMSTLTATAPDASAAPWVAVGILALLAVIFTPIGIALMLPDRRTDS